MKSLIKNLFPKYYKSKKFKRIHSLQLETIKNKKSIEPELLLLDNFIKMDDVCIDVGGNKGYYTYKFEQLTQSSNIYTFEPILANYKFLKKLFHQCHIFNYALSNKNCISKFKIPIVNNKLLHTRGKLDFKIIEENETDFQTVNVECITLDSFVNTRNIKKIDFMKVDVEGNELNVIHGATESIKKFKPTILIEIEQRVHDFDINKIFNYILELGYEINFYDLENLELKSINNFSISEHQNYNNIKTIKYINNFFCIPI